MAVSEHVRNQVLRRDNQTCRYCGRLAHGVVLTIDPVSPVGPGGTDPPDNLVAACEDCQGRKAGTSADEPPGADNWVTAIKEATIEMVLRQTNRATRLEVIAAQRAEHADFAALWESWDRQGLHMPSDWLDQLNAWEADGLTTSEVVECLSIAISRRNPAFEERRVADVHVFAYTRGVARKKIA